MLSIIYSVRLQNIFVLNEISRLNSYLSLNDRFQQLEFFGKMLKANIYRRQLNFIIFSIFEIYLVFGKASYKSMLNNMQIILNFIYNYGNMNVHEFLLID